jgi:hypothetical protein
LDFAQEADPPAFSWPLLWRSNSNRERFDQCRGQGSEVVKLSAQFEFVEKFQSAIISTFHPANNNSGDQGLLAGEMVLQCRGIFLASLSGDLSHRHGIKAALRIETLRRTEQRFFRRIPVERWIFTRYGFLHRRFLA